VRCKPAIPTPAKRPEQQKLNNKTQRASYHETRLQTATLLATDPSAAERSITAVFAAYSVPQHVVTELTDHLRAAGTEELVDFLTRFEHCAEEPPTSRALTSALTIALAYFLGGLVPLLPYLCVGRDEVMLGLWISVGVMAVALFSFGYVKTCIVAGWEGARCIRMGLFSGVQMVVVGGAAAGAAMGLVKLFDGIAGS
jgi:VIT1/CCC1 family predicted Fe2+/Mn2+ transporter